MRNEAALRLRNSIVAFIVLLVLTHLSPLPSLWASTWLVWESVTMTKKADIGCTWWSICIAQGIACSALLLTILQASFALKYPRKPHPPLATPSKSLHATPASTSQKQLKFKTMSPHTRSQKQKIFPLSSSYTSSPVSTPTRTLNYTLPSTISPFSTSLSSSISTSVPASPSPLLSSPLAAYRGKHAQPIGYALNGSYLGKVASDDDSDQD